MQRALRSSGRWKLLYGDGFGWLHAAGRSSDECMRSVAAPRKFACYMWEFAL